LNTAPTPAAKESETAKQKEQKKKGKKRKKAQILGHAFIPLSSLPAQQSHEKYLDRYSEQDKKQLEQKPSKTKQGNKKKKQKKKKNKRK
jgi:hypothetical protein